MLLSSCHRWFGELQLLNRVINRASALAISLGLSQTVAAADLPSSSPPPPVFTQSNPSFLSGWEVRGGVFGSTWAAEKGEVNINGEVISPRLYQLQGWEAYLIPKWQFGATGNVEGGTSYAYTGPIWNIEYQRFFVDLSVGGAIHNGQLTFNNYDPSRNVLGCRVLYHTGADVGYEFDEHWSGMVTFDHISNGAGTLSDCHINQGATILGARIGYRF